MVGYFEISDGFHECFGVLGHAGAECEYCVEGISFMPLHDFVCESLAEVPSGCDSLAFDECAGDFEFAVGG